jgi:osmotically inducible protein OsmC
MAEYIAKATTTAGRNGHVDSADGLIHFDLSIPKELGGPGKSGATNPEQLFAAGYSACFGSALGVVAGQEKIKPESIHVEADVPLHHDDSGFSLSVVLKSKLDGIERAEAERLVHKAHEICPYSKATRNNVNVTLEVV